MKVLFIGGTGVVSSACSELALEQGIELYHLNRGETKRPLSRKIKHIRADIRDFEATRKALNGHQFDVVVNWIVYTPDQLENDLRLFNGKTGQYIFISTASAYQTPPNSLPVTESTPLYNPIWNYSQAKIACEDRLQLAYHDEQFPMTIVRPSHTYDKTKLVISGHYTALDRMKRGLPVIVHGDGTSLWTVTHHRDFAKGFVGLLGNPAAIGEAIHITSDEVLTWNRIFEITAHAAGVEPKLVHVPSEVIARVDREWGAGLLGDKMHSMIFDNTKIKRLVPGYQATIPFHRGVRETIEWYDQNPALQVVDEKLNQTIEKLLTAI